MAKRNKKTQKEIVYHYTIDYVLWYLQKYGSPIKCPFGDIDEKTRGNLVKFNIRLDLIDDHSYNGCVYSLHE